MLPKCAGPAEGLGIPAQLTANGPEAGALDATVTQVFPLKWLQVRVLGSHGNPTLPVGRCCTSGVNLPGSTKSKVVLKLGAGQGSLNGKSRSEVGRCCF